MEEANCTAGILCVLTLNCLALRLESWLAGRRSVGLSVCLSVCFYY